MQDVSIDDIHDHVSRLDIAELYKQFNDTSDSVYYDITQNMDSDFVQIIGDLFNIKCVINTNLKIYSNYERVLYLISHIVEYGKLISKHNGINTINNLNVMDDIKNKIDLLINDSREKIRYELSLFVCAINSGILENITVLNESTIQASEDVKNIYSNSGVDFFSKDFSEIEKKEKNAKMIWLSISVILLLSIITSMYVVGTNILDLIYFKSENYKAAIALYAVRIPVVIISIFGFLWFAKRYTIAREKEIFYRHIASVLFTFKSFYKTVENQHKGIVVIEAAKVVFPAPIEKKSDIAMDSSKILDVVKLLSQVKTGSAGSGSA